MFMSDLTCLFLTISVFHGYLVTGTAFCNDTSVSNGNGFLTWKKEKLAEDQKVVGIYLGYTIATTLNSTLSSKFQDKSQTSGTLKMTVCPLKGKIKKLSALKQFKASLMFLHQYLTFLEEKQAEEKKQMESFLFHSCDELNLSLKNATDDVCSFLGRLGPGSGNVTVFLKPKDANKMHIRDTLAIFQNFGECFMEKGLTFSLMKNCSGPVLAGCRGKGKNRNKRRKGKGSNRKGRKGGGKARRGRKARKARKGNKRN